MRSFNKLANLHRVFFKRAEGERLKVNPNDSGKAELPDPVHRYPPGFYDKLFPSKVPSKVPPKVPPKVPSKVPPKVPSKVPPGKATATPPQQKVPTFPTRSGVFDNPNDPVPY